jgi:hypothetical protein
LRLLIPLISASCHRIPLQFDYLPQHGFLIQAMHERLYVALVFGAASIFFSHFWTPSGLDSTDAGFTPLHSNLFDDTQVGARRRVAQVSINIAPVTGMLLLDLKQTLCRGKAIKNRVKGWLQDGQGWVFALDFKHESLQMPLDRDLRGKLFCAQELGFSLPVVGSW